MTIDPKPAARIAAPMASGVPVVPALTRTEQNALVEKFSASPCRLGAVV